MRRKGNRAIFFAVIEEDLDSDHDKDGTHSSSSASSNGSDAASHSGGDSSNGEEEEEQRDTNSGSRNASSGSEEEEEPDTNSGSRNASSGGEEEEEQSDTNSGSRNASSGGKEEEEQSDTNSGSRNASSGGEEEEEDGEEEEQIPAKGGNDLAFQLIDENCTFNILGMNDFETKVNLRQRGRSYAVVAIMGPQSSGKSTLLNHLFHTNFKEMADIGRGQTTKGIWLARCPDIEPLTLVIDMEGTDGSERGEDTTFENRSALFALAIADVVLINMDYKYIGRHKAANYHLFKNVFEQVLVRFSDRQRKITLIIVVRDKKQFRTEEQSSSEEKVEAQLKNGIKKIWSSIRKPPGKNDIKLRDFFKVEVKFLPHYEERLNDFKIEVGKFRQRFVNSTAPAGLVGDRKDSASAFSKTAKILWDEIMANKNLSIPSLQVLAETYRCDDIKDEKYISFENNEVWCKLNQTEDNLFNCDFGKIVNSILNTCLSKYDEETEYFHEATKKKKRKELIEKLSKCVQPVYLRNMRNLRLEHLREFMKAIDSTSSDEQNTFARFADGCMQNCLHEFIKDCEVVKIDIANWTTSEETSKLVNDMKSYVRTKGEDKVDSKITRLYKPDLRLKLLDRVRYLLCEETDPTWSKVRKHFKRVVKSTISELSGTLTEFGINEKDTEKWVEKIENYAKDVVIAKVREESGRAKEHMMTKFLKIFKADYDWNNDEEINRAAKKAKYMPMDVLVGLTAIRLEDGDSDNIGHILCSALLGSGDPNLSNLLASHSWAKRLVVLSDLAAIRAKAGNNIGHVLSSAVLGSGNNSTLKLLNSSSWSQVPYERTLITPIKCKELWEKYLIDVENAVNKAIKDFEARRNTPCACDCCTIV